MITITVVIFLNVSFIIIWRLFELTQDFILSEISNLKDTLEQQLLNSQIEMSDKIMSIEENNMSLFNSQVNVKNETDEKIDKMGAWLATIVQPLV